MTALISDGTLDAFLSSALEAGRFRIGQVAIALAGNGWRICHFEDVDRTGLEGFDGAAAARTIALYDDGGRYRPLKTAPTLRHGWQLTVGSVTELRQALDFIYPAAIGNLRSWLRGTLAPVSLRDTVNRQTGMYRIAGKITDEQAESLVATLCHGGCLRHILWPVAPDGMGSPPGDAPGHLPLLCGEACNLLIAAARKVVKGIPLDQTD
jgi:sirohydrochlorin cobaltochelatase